MPQNPTQTPPPLPVAARAVDITLDYATAPRLARGIAWQRSPGHLHLAFETPRSVAGVAVSAAGGVMLLGLLVASAVICSGIGAGSSREVGLAILIGSAAVAVSAIGILCVGLHRRKAMAPPVELDATPDSLSLLIPAHSRTPLVWPAGRLREIRCSAVPGYFCVEVFPADAPPEEHWFDIAGELAPELIEIELRQILRLGEATAPLNPAAPLSYATPALPVEQHTARIPWIRRSDYVLVLLPPPKSAPWHGIIMSLGVVGALAAFIHLLLTFLVLDDPTIPLVCLFAGTTLAGLIGACVVGRRNRTRPLRGDRSTLVMACPQRLWLHVRSTTTDAECFSAQQARALSITADRRGLWLHLQSIDGVSIERFLPTGARAAGAALCDDLRRILHARGVRGL